MNKNSINLMLPNIENFKNQVKDIEDHQESADKSLDYMLKKFEQDVDDFLKRYQTIASFQVKFRAVPEQAEWNSYDELPTSQTMSQLSHTELLALKLKRICWDEDTDGNIKRV